MFGLNKWDKKRIDRNVYDIARLDTLIDALWRAWYIPGEVEQMRERSTDQEIIINDLIEMVEDLNKKLEFSCQEGDIQMDIVHARINQMECEHPKDRIYNDDFGNKICDACGKAW